MGGGGENSFTFDDLFYTLVFLLSLWVAGKLFAKAGLPALVGEICVGILMGPHGLDILESHFVVSAKLIGEIGLLLLVLEAGLDVDIAMLKIIGMRGFAVGVIGSLLPLGIGFGLATALGSETKAALCIGATLAPTSMGIALNVLRSGKVLNTPTGQLVIAAAVLDDVLALIILSEIKALSDPTPLNFIMPVAVSAFFLLFFGYLAVKVLPHHLDHQLHKIKKEKDRENVILALLFGSTLIMIPTCYYLKSSYLLGAFLAGFMFCTDHTAHAAWIKQVKRIMQWLLRIFFGGTIAFEVPIGDFWTGPVLKNAGIYMVAIVGKLVQGFWASPLTASEFWKISWAMSAWGEFAFIIAGYANTNHLITPDEFSSLILAVLLSVIISPVMLGITIRHYAKKSDAKMDKHIENDQHVFYYIDMRAQPKWGIQDKIHDALDELELEVVDFRAWHARNMEDKGPTFVFNEIYLRDHILVMPSVPFIDLDDENQEILEKRVHDIHDKLDEVIQVTKKDAETPVDDEEMGCVNISRWIPHQDDSDGHETSEEEHVHMTFEPEYTLHHIDPKDCAGGEHGHHQADHKHATLDPGHMVVDPGHMHTSHRLNKIAVKALHGYICPDDQIPHDKREQDALHETLHPNKKKETTTGLDILNEDQEKKPGVTVEMQPRGSTLEDPKVDDISTLKDKDATMKEKLAYETIAVDLSPRSAAAKAKKKGSPRKGSPRKVQTSLKLKQPENEAEMTSMAVIPAGPRTGHKQRSGKIDVLDSVMSTKNITGDGARHVAQIVRIDLNHKEHHLHQSMMAMAGGNDEKAKRAKWKHKRAPLKGGSGKYYR